MTFITHSARLWSGAILALAFMTGPATAAPFVDIRSFWSAQLNPNMPPPNGIAVSCFGGATAFSGGCFGELALQQSVTAPGTYTALLSGGLTITNTTQGALSGYADFIGGYSAFNPGGPDEGIGIDNPLTQWARFSSRVGGDAFSDAHSCAIGFLRTSGTVFSPTTCGVESPDASFGGFGIDLATLPPMSAIDILFTLAIETEFVFADTPVGVPEPAGAALLLTGLGAIVALRRRTVKARYGAIRQSTR